MSRAAEFKQLLRQRPLVLDGGLGARLIQNGLPRGVAPDLWNLENPSAVEKVHQEFAAAGADILLTNTFGASRSRLALTGADSRLREINQQAVHLARQAGGESCFVAGNIGPAGVLARPTKERSSAQEIYREQSEILVEAGVDLMVIETMLESNELAAAARAVREVSASIPLVALMTFSGESAIDGTTPEKLVELAEHLDCDAVGVNCCGDLDSILTIVRRMALVGSECALVAEPSAGLPEVREGRWQYPLSEDELAPFIDQLFAAGVRILGGCCGTTPDFIRMIRRYVDSL